VSGQRVRRPRLVAVGDATLAVREWGGRDGATTVVFWHGLGSFASGAEIVEVAPRLEAAGFRVVAVDAPGFGESPVLPPERYRLDALGVLLQRLVADLRLEPLVLIGHSWGAAVVAYYAGEHPDQVRALVLLEGGHFDVCDLPSIDASRPAEAWIGDARGQPACWKSREALESERRGRMKRFSPELLDAYAAGTRAVGTALVGSSAEARGAAMSGLLNRVSGAWPVISMNKIPTLLLLASEPPHADQNRAYVDAFQAAVPHAITRWVPDAGHNLLADVGPSLGDEIAMWLRGVAKW